MAGLGKWWGVGLLTVLIPVAHFILVPLFLAYGVWQFFERLGTVELATDARAAPVPIEAPTRHSSSRRAGARRSP